MCRLKCSKIRALNLQSLVFYHVVRKIQDKVKKEIFIDIC